MYNAAKRALSKMLMDNRVFVILNWSIYIHIVYLYLCHKMSNPIIVVLTVFHRYKLKFKGIKATRKVGTA